MTAFCLHVAQSLNACFFFPGSLCSQQLSLWITVMSIFLGTILYLQCILKDLFFGVDLGGIEVTQCFFYNFKSTGVFRWRQEGEEAKLIIIIIPSQLQAA